MAFHLFVVFEILKTTFKFLYISAIELPPLAFLQIVEFKRGYHAADAHNAVLLYVGKNIHFVTIPVITLPFLPALTPGNSAD
jgi:hypothetical protein